MLVKPYWQLTCIGLALLAPVAHAQEVGNDIPPSHWAYTAVKDLAGKGLIKGYPPDSKFLGTRPVTRYEMATILQRVIARMEETLAKPTVNKGDLDKLQSSIDEIRNLTDEFKKELLVIGTDLSKVKDDIAALKGEVANLSTKVDAMDSKITAAQKAADAAGKRADDANKGVDAALESLKELKNSTQDLLAKKANVSNFGNRSVPLEIGATIHAWYVTPFGGSPNGNTPLNTSSNPAGRSWGGGDGDTFRIKRAELYFDGTVTPKLTGKPGNAYYFVLIDTGKVFSSSSSSTSTTVNGVTTTTTATNANASTTFLQDAFVGYQFGSRYRFEIGQQKTDMDEEGSRSSAKLTFAERSIMNLLPVNVGRVGYVRDVGAVVRYSSTQGKAMIGVWNGNGQDQGTVAGASNGQDPTVVGTKTVLNRQKFADFNAYYNGFRRFNLGVWGGTQIGDAQPYIGRDRLGATVQYTNGRHSVEFEGAATRDYAPGSKPGTGTNGRGGYLSYGYQMSKKIQFAGRVDVWNPAYQAGEKFASVTAIGGQVFKHGGNDLREYTFGVNYYITGDEHAKFQFNYVIDDPDHNAISFWGQRRDLFVTNFQIAF